VAKNTGILTVNSGSSSLKASLFRADGGRRDFRYAHIGGEALRDHAAAFDRLLAELGASRPAAVGHRFVHGGEITQAARRIDAAERARLDSIRHLAPLHLPSNLLGADLCAKHFKAPQVACFDTAFHATLPDIAKRLPIPREFGLRRFGFHGVNYAYVASILPDLLGETAYGRIAVAHLGNGASLCLLENLRSIDTTMGYTPAGGVPMGTRSGDLDPGVMLELAARYRGDALSDLVYHRMGLLALSDGEHAEMDALLASQSAAARFAVDYFCRQVRGAIGALAAKAGGLDALIFTAGIGERAAPVRAAICAPLGFLNIRLDPEANAAHRTVISAAHSKPVMIIPADEESMIRQLTQAVLQEEKSA